MSTDPNPIPETPTQPTPTLESLQRQFLDFKIEQLRAQGIDHEERLRTLETIGTKFNVLYGLFAGNGLMSLIILFKLFAETPP